MKLVEGSLIISGIWDSSEAEVWVRRGVEDAQLAEHIFKLADELLELNEADPIKLALALHYIRGLSGRHLLSKLVSALCRCTSIDSQRHSDAHCWFLTQNPLHQFNPVQTAWRQERMARLQQADGVSYFVEAHPLIAEHTLGETALRVFTELAPSGHPTRVAMQNSLAYHLKTQQHDSDGLVSWLWEITGSRDPLAPLVPYLSLCLEHQPERAKALAVRVALINPDEAISVCSSLAQLEEPIKEMFKTELYRQLMRIGQIKLWASCKVSLS